MMLRLIQHVLGTALVWLAVSGTAFAVPTSTHVGPDPAKHCYSNAFTPETYETVSERVIIHPGLEQTRNIPAVYEQRRLQFMVKEPVIAYQTASPRYALIFEDVLVEPARKIDVKIPAKYETWIETVEVEPAKVIWKSGKSLYQPDSPRSAALTTDGAPQEIGSILCKVLIPAKKRTVHHTRMVSPPRTETQTVPARYKRVARQVVQKPGFARKMAVSAEFASIPYEKQLIAARQDVEVVPATYKDVEKEVVKHPSKLIQVAALCDQQASRETVRQLQTALVDRGYVIAIDGIYGPETQGAVEQFQRDQTLARGYMTVETFNAFGVSPTPCSAVDCGQHRAQTTITATQQALTAAGYLAVPDGIHGPQTQSALEQFQVANGLEVGYLSAETMQALNIIARI